MRARARAHTHTHTHTHTTVVIIIIITIIIITHKTSEGVHICAMQACICGTQGGVRDITLIVHNLDTRWKWVVTFTPWLLNPRYPLNRRFSGPQTTSHFILIPHATIISKPFTVHLHAHFLLFPLSDGGRRSLRNVGASLPNCTASHTIRNSYLYAQLWELEVLIAFSIFFLLWILDIGLEIFV